MAERIDSSPYLLVFLGIITRQLVRDDAHFSARLFDADPPLQFPHCAQKIVSPSALRRVAQNQSAPQLNAASWKQKVARHDADHCVSLVIETDRLAQDVRS